jgi:hypothetical protein
MSNQKMVFIDTEFTDLLDPRLISIGMVAETGEELYIEIPFSFKHCSEFVREAVLPQLGKVPEAFCPLPRLRDRIITFLARVRAGEGEIVVAYDYSTDWWLLHEAINGNPPGWVRNALVWSNLNELLIEDYWNKTGESRHHALHDARANRYAYRPKPPEMTTNSERLGS